METAVLAATVIDLSDPPWFIGTIIVLILAVVGLFHVIRWR